VPKLSKRCADEDNANIAAVLTRKQVFTDAAVPQHLFKMLHLVTLRFSIFNETMLLDVVQWTNVFTNATIGSALSPQALADQRDSLLTPTKNHRGLPAAR
jgi:hypothetical protein